MSDASAVRATRPAADEFAPYYGTYIDKVADGDVLRTMRTQHEATQSLLAGLDEAQGAHRYAAGKWSVREVIGHLIDAERIFAYRALRFARGDETPLASFDENAYIERAKFEARTVDSLREEFAAVRNATLHLFAALDDEEWQRRGTASGKVMSVRGLAWVIAGHEAHHVGLLRTRYFGDGA